MEFQKAYKDLQLFLVWKQSSLLPEILIPVRSLVQVRDGGGEATAAASKCQRSPTARHQLQLPWAELNIGHVVSSTLEVRISRIKLKFDQNDGDLVFEEKNRYEICATLLISFVWSHHVLLHNMHSRKPFVSKYFSFFRLFWTFLASFHVFFFKTLWRKSLKRTHCIFCPRPWRFFMISLPAAVVTTRFTRIFSFLFSYPGPCQRNWTVNHVRLVPLPLRRSYV